MTIDITSVVVSLIGLIAIFISTVIYPRIKANLPAEQWNMLVNYAIAAVQAAEILFGAGHGKEKLGYAMKYIEKECVAHGIKVDTDSVRVAVENAWKQLGFDKKDGD